MTAPIPTVMHERRYLQMSMNSFKARAYLAATTAVTTGLAVYAFAAPHNRPN